MVAATGTWRAVAVVATVSCTAFVAYVWRWRAKMQEVETSLACTCGKFRAKVLFSTGSVIASCSCKDCTAYFTNPLFTEPLSESAPLPASHVQIFKANFETTSLDLVSCAMLKPGTFLLRCHSTCCNCPLFMTPNMQAYPMLIVNTQRITEKHKLPKPMYELDGEPPASFFALLLKNAFLGLISRLGDRKLLGKLDTTKVIYLS
eukprot:6188144-Pleurochrysis_carterae.AAC.3